MWQSKLVGMGRFLLPAMLATCVATVAKADSAASPTKIKVLILDGQNNHNWQATTPHLKKILEMTGRFTVTVATTPAKVDAPKPPRVNSAPANERYKRDLARFMQYKKKMEQFHPELAKFDVVLSNYNGDFWSKRFEKSLQQYVQNGRGGLVIVHAANNSFPGWSEYDRMIGMGWRDNRYGDRLTLNAKGRPVRIPKGKGPGAGHGNQHAFLVTIRDAKHPITEGMPSEWLHSQDELYQGMRGPVSKVHLLATAFADRKKGGPSSSNEHEPMIWTVTYEKGRVFHTPMGHDLTGMRCLGFVATLQRGTEWAATGKVTIALPKNFPTDKKTSSLKTK